jgi:preprotein translocase subunit SecG
VVTYLNVAEIIISIVLILVLLVQTRGAGFNGTFNSDSSVYRSRRGLEKTLFQLTIGLTIVFVIVSVLSVIAAKAA